MIRIPYPVVLASASPRRVELLRTLIPDFVTDPAELDEDEHTCLDPVATAQRLAREKALVVAERHPEALVIGGDTVVAVDERQLAKPSNSVEALEMLQLLSGRSHRVITGVALRWPKGFHLFAAISVVTMRDLGAQEIAEYVATPEPYDKAGGYAVQGAARKFIVKIQGSESNVVGLPLELLEESLREIR